MKFLSLEQKQIFDSQGYLVVEDVLDQTSVIEPIRREYEQLMNELYDRWLADGLVDKSAADLDFWGKLRAAYEAGCDWFQPMDISLPGDKISADTPMHFGPAVFAMVKNKRLLDLVEDLIGAEITSNPIQHVRIKPPMKALREGEVRAHITQTDWHQDRAVGLENADNTDMVTVWLAITDATPENGCLQVLPKSANQAMLPHCPKTQTAIADGFIDETKAIPLPVKSGGAVIFHPLTPHASLANTTPGFRWSFDIRFNVTGQSTGREHFPEFIARSLIDPSRELNSWQDWKAVWDDARTRLSASPHVDIHRWKSDAPFCA